MGGEGHAEVGDQAGKFVQISNIDIDAMNKYNLYADILHIVVKENKYTDKKSLK